MGDYEQYGVPEFWAEAMKEGDCEDYALAKFKDLRDAGVPLEALRLACVFTETSGYHAVLVVTTENGDWVLDNRFDDIYQTLGSKGYTLDKIWSHELQAWVTG